ncbi:MAG: helix-turn-helix transcriptional regulator, partial [Eubacteriales bacterium]
LEQSGLTLKRLIQENYATQEDFAYDYGVDLRTVQRYISSGINKVTAIQELADFFEVPFATFFEKP